MLLTQLEAVQNERDRLARLLSETELKLKQSKLENLKKEGNEIEADEAKLAADEAQERIEELEVGFCISQYVYILYRKSFKKKREPELS